MKNTRVADRQEMGPRSAAPAPAVATAAQVEVYQRLLGRPAAVTVGQLASECGQHPNTVREHLGALTRLGFVEQRSAAPQGRGRPAYRYAARPATMSGAHLAVVDALATHLAGSTSDALAAAVELGRRCGDQLPAAPAPAGHPPAATATGPAAARRALRTVAEVMRGLGFSVRVSRDGSVARLLTCPLLDAARVHPQVVCGVHRGLVDAVAGGAGAAARAVRLVPFAEPGACLLRLDPPAAPATPA